MTLVAKKQLCFSILSDPMFSAFRLNTCSYSSLLHFSRSLFWDIWHFSRRLFKRIDIFQSEFSIKTASALYDEKDTWWFLEKVTPWQMQKTFNREQISKGFPTSIRRRDECRHSSASFLSRHRRWSVPSQRSCKHNTKRRFQSAFGHKRGFLGISDQTQ